MSSRVTPQVATEGTVSEAVISSEEFAALYDEHRPALYRFCLARTRNPALAEDIVQEVFAKAFAARSTFDVHRRFWPWLASIAARQCKDAYRRQAYATSRLADLARADCAQPFDATAATVLRRMDHEHLADEVARLPDRQRVALQLFAFDGWTYAEIAAQFGHTVDGIKALIVRARTRLRDAAVPTLVAIPDLHRVRARLRRAAVRVQVALSSSADGLGAWMQGAFVQPASVVAVVMAVALLAPPGTTVARAAEGRPSLSSSPPAVVPSPPPPPPSGADTPRRPASAVTTASEPAPRVIASEAQRTVVQTVSPVMPTSSPVTAGPESMPVTAMAVSPGNDGDESVFVAGGPPGSGTLAWAGPASLLVSHDGPASWHPARAIGLAPVVRLFTAPAYPRDRRLFAATAIGLQVSRDDGETFETLAPLPGVTDASISPAFHAGDPSILLVAGERLWEYRDDSLLLEPLMLDGRVVSVGHAREDRTVFVSFMPSWEDRRRASGLYFGRCGRQRLLGHSQFDCASAWVADGTLEAPIRLSPISGSGLLYLPIKHEPLVSIDGGRTFRPARACCFEADDGYGYTNYDLVALPSRTGQSAVMAQKGFRVGKAYGDGPPLARTDDGGQTWTPLWVDVPGFAYGANKVAVTSSGRIVAAAIKGGLACSADGGRTWARTCPRARP